MSKTVTGRPKSCERHVSDADFSLSSRSQSSGRADRSFKGPLWNRFGALCQRICSDLRRIRIYQGRKRRTVRIYFDLKYDSSLMHFTEPPSELNARGERLREPQFLVDQRKSCLIWVSVNKSKSPWDLERSCDNVLRVVSRSARHKVPAYDTTGFIMCTTLYAISVVYVAEILPVLLSLQL